MDISARVGLLFHYSSSMKTFTELIQECKVQEVKAADTSSGDTNSSGTVWHESSMLGNECSERSNSGDDTDTKPSYDTKPMVDSNTTPDSSDICNNEFEDDQNADDHEDERVVIANFNYLLMPLAEKTRVNASEFEKVLKEEMFEDLQYVQYLEKELDALQSDKDEFSNEYDLLLQECLSKDIMCAILHSFKSLDEKTELQCLYLEKHAEYDNLEIELSKCKSQFVELEKHSQLKDNTIANAEMRKSWNKMKGKSVDTNVGKPSILGKLPLQGIINQPVVRQLTAFNSERSSFLKTRTSGGIQFLVDKLVSWMSKKQDCTAMSSTEVEYVALSASCA
ncbi:hypothetical protein Tco_0373912 [Tanacetum coccineum]